MDLTTSRDVALLCERIEAEATLSLFEGAADLAREAGIRWQRVDGAVVLIAPATRSLMYNRVQGLGLETPVSDERLDALVAEFASAGPPRWMIQVCPEAEPVDLPDRLGERGFSPFNQWAKLHRRAGTLPEVADVAVERIEPGAGVEAVRLALASFGHPPEYERWLTAALATPGWDHYRAIVDGQLAATAAMFVRDDVAWLGLAATRPEFRGRGAQSALIARRARDAAARGCEWLVTETAVPSPEDPAPSYRNMRRLGFDVAYLRPNRLNVLRDA